MKPSITDTSTPSLYPYPGFRGTFFLKKIRTAFLRPPGDLLRPGRVISTSLCLRTSPRCSRHGTHSRPLTSPGHTLAMPLLSSQALWSQFYFTETLKAALYWIRPWFIELSIVSVAGRVQSRVFPNISCLEMPGFEPGPICMQSRYFSTEQQHYVNIHYIHVVLIALLWVQMKEFSLPLSHYLLTRPKSQSKMGIDGKRSHIRFPYE